jgi:hypothetical protein
MPLLLLPQPRPSAGQMGCGRHSKLEEELAVRHYQEHSDQLTLAIRHCYALAEAHRA